MKLTITYIFIRLKSFPLGRCPQDRWAHEKNTRHTEQTDWRCASGITDCNQYEASLSGFCY